MSPLSRRQFLGAATGLVIVGATGHSPAKAVTINPRDSWAVDRPPKGPLSGEDVKFLLVHHSASRNGHTGADAPAILRSFYDFHTSPEKGWNDIAYNFLIDADGGIWEGRFGSLAGPVAGDATGGNQGFSQLVCVIGDYNSAQPTAASKSSLVALLAWLADRYGVATASGSEVTFTSRGSNRWPAGTSVTTPTITGHRTMSKTTCPGDNLYAYVAGSLMSDVDAARGGTVAPAPTTTTTQAATTTTEATTTSTTVAPTTTTSAPTTTVPPTSTTIRPTTTVPQATTVPEPSTTSAQSAAGSTRSEPVPIAVADTPPSPPPTGLLATAGSMVLGGLALLAWRKRRIDSGS